MKQRMFCIVALFVVMTGTVSFGCGKGKSASDQDIEKTISAGTMKSTAPPSTGEKAAPAASGKAATTP